MLESYQFPPSVQEAVIKPIKALFIPILKLLTEVKIPINGYILRIYYHLNPKITIRQ
jgi:hypothetical protein